MSEWGSDEWKAEWGAGPVAPSKPDAKSGWGYGLWGTSNWGSVGDLPPVIHSISPGVLEVEGGTILTITGANFAPEFIPEVMTGSEVVAVGYLFDPDFDLTTMLAKPGMPAMPAGVYSLRVRTPAGVSGILVDALTYKPHAEEVYGQKGRSSWANKWATGVKIGA